MANLENLNGYKRLNSILIVVGLLLVLVCPFVVTQPYLLHILIMIFWTAACGLAWNIIGGFTGQFSLGHAVFLGIGAYASAIAQAKLEWNPLVGLVIGMVISVAFAFLFFYPCFELRGPYFTLVTLAMGVAIRNLFINWGYIGKMEGILYPFKGNASWEWFQFTSKIPYYYVAFAILLGFIWISRYISKSRLGYALMTIRGNENTALAVGINTARYKAYAVMISACLMSVTGSFYSHYVRFVDPDIMVTFRSVEIVLPCIIGGLGTVAGPIIGAVIINPVTEWLRSSLGGKLAGLHYVIIAAVMIALIEVKPNGLHDWVAGLYRKALGRIAGFFPGLGKPDPAKRGS